MKLMFFPSFLFFRMFQRQKGKGKRSNLEETSNGTSNGVQSKKLKNGDNAKTSNGYHNSTNYIFSEVLHNQKKQLSSIWKNEKNITADEALKDIELIREPFQCCSIKNVIQRSQSFTSLMAYFRQDINSQSFFI